MQRPVPPGTPMRLPAQVAGSLSRIQGQLQAAHPRIQDAYAMHWLALRHAGFMPEFQQFTQHMMWGAYGTLALGGLINHALSGRATPEVMGGVVDQLRFLQEQYGQAAGSLEAFLQDPEARTVPGVPAMTAALRPIDELYHTVQEPKETVIQDMRWRPGPMLDLPQIRRTDIERAPETPAGGES